MSGSQPQPQPSNTMPKLGHVTDLREQWLVRADGQLAHRLQDREISSHLCENRYRNQQIREDFPLALHEQRGIEHEVRMRELAILRQAEVDAEIAREMAEMNLRKQRERRQLKNDVQPCSSRAVPAVVIPEIPERCSISQLNAAICAPSDVNLDELGLSPDELEEMRDRLEQEERDARLARELSHQVDGQDALLADMKCAVEAQDSELARLLQEREYKKLQRAKEKARQKALLKKQQRLAQQQNVSEAETPQSQLCDAYSNPRDMIRDTKVMGQRLCKSVDSDLNYVEPFEKEQIQSKANALQAREISRQFYSQPEPSTSTSNVNLSHGYSRSFDADKPGLPPPNSNTSSLNHRLPPPPPAVGKKPRFPDPVSIRPASHYPTDNPGEDEARSSYKPNLSHSYSENNNLYSSAFPMEDDCRQMSIDRPDTSKRLSVISDITAEGLAKKKNKQEKQKRKGCKIQ